MQYNPGSPGTPATPGATASWVGTDTAGVDVYQDPNGYLYSRNPDGSASNYSGPAAAGPIGLGTGPNRLDAQTTQYAQNNTQRYGI
jgi:hypothetical protein